MDGGSDYGDEIEWPAEEELKLQALEQLHLTKPIPIRNVDIAPEHELILAPTPPPAQNVTPSIGVQVVDVQEEDQRSLYERFRKRRGWGSLSVSDLVGLSWCETQTIYRLSSRGNLPTAQRPTTLISAAGNEVQVNTKRSEARDVILEKGRQVHKVLEDELIVELEKVVVQANGNEEFWCLKILDILAGLERLLVFGVAVSQFILSYTWIYPADRNVTQREIPVFGLVEGFLVFGVIDQVDRREESETTTSTPVSLSINASTSLSRSSSNLPYDQTKIDQHFPPSPKSVFKPNPATSNTAGIIIEEKKRWSFVLSDTKTRHSNSLPPKADSRASRLQLMLYHRLFTTLLTSKSTDTTPAFPWEDLFSHITLDPLATLSEEFLLAIQPLLVQSNLGLETATTLMDFILALQRYGDFMRGDEENDSILDEELEISYRLRNNVRGWKESRAAKRQRLLEEMKRKTPNEEEEEELERELRQTLLVDDEEMEVDYIVEEKVVEEYESSDSGEEGDLEIIRLLIPPPREPSPPPPPVMEGTLIGYERFKFEEVQLNDWVRSATQFWTGEREAVGVSIDQTSRCR